MSDPNPAVTEPQAAPCSDPSPSTPGCSSTTCSTAEDLAQAMAEEIGKTHNRNFTPMVTLASFLVQVLSDEHTCLPAVGGLIAWRAARGLAPCSPDTGGDCKARRRLPRGAVARGSATPPTAQGATRRPGCSTAAAWSSPTARLSACRTPPRTRPSAPALTLTY